MHAMIARLNKNEIEMLHDASCRILEEIGIIIHYEPAARILESHGATLHANGVVKIPKKLIMQAIETAKPAFDLYDRRGGKLELGKGRHYHAVGGTMVNVMDYPSWTRRRATTADLVELVRLCDTLPLIDIVVPIVLPGNVDVDRQEVMAYAETLGNTTKHCLVGPSTYRNAKAWIDLARIANVGESLREKPVISLVVSILPGLEMDGESVRMMILAAEEGIPVVIMGAAMAGVQAPITLAGAITLENASQLATLALVQCVFAGSPVLLVCGCQTMDLRIGNLISNGPENVIAVSIMAQLAQYYQIPTYACTADTDAKIGDVQAGMEKMGGMLGSVLDGVDVTINASVLN
jgi:trimethylamine--corrinoid protein Co-methyltransferase